MNFELVAGGNGNLTRIYRLVFFCANCVRLNPITCIKRSVCISDIL